MAQVNLILQGTDNITGAVESAAGALSNLGNIAGNLLTAGFDLAAKGAGLLTDGLKFAIGEAMEGEKVMARLGNLLENQSEAAIKNGEAWAEAQGKFIVNTAASELQLEEWSDDLRMAEARLFDMQKRLADKEPTEVQKVQLDELQAKIIGLRMHIQEGSQIITTSMTDALGLVAPTALLTMDAIEKLGAQFQDLAGGTDDVVYSIIEMGLRMGNITANQMPDFIQTALDLAAATGQDAVAAARLLAQSMEDPISALTRFRRMGILFSEDLEAQIKKMVDAGDTAGAFALVMDRLGESVEGAAEAAAGTLAGQIEIVKNRMGEAAETIGQSFMPLAHRLFEEVIKPAIPIVEGLAATLAAFVTAIAGGGDLSKAFDALAGGIYRAFGPEAGLAVMQFGQFFVGLLEQIPGWVDGILLALAPIITAAQGMALAFAESMPRIQQYFADAVAFVQARFAEFAPVIIANVGETLEQLTTFWRTHGETIMAIVNGAWQFIVVTVGGFLVLLSGAIAAGLALMNGDTETAHATMESSWVRFLNSVLSIVNTDLKRVQDSWAGTFELLSIIHSATFALILSRTMTLVGSFYVAGQALMNGLKDGILSVAQAMVDAVVQSVVRAIVAAKAALKIESPSKVFAGIGANMMAGMAEGISGNASQPISAVRAVSNATTNNNGGNTYNYYGVLGDMDMAYQSARAGAM